MAKHRTSGGANSVTNEINTLKDGVGRQAPSKRMPTEAEEIINCQVTLERNIQKRPGMQAVLNVNNLTWDGEYDGETAPAVPADNSGEYTAVGTVDERIGLNSEQDAKYIWFELSANDLFLIQILLSDNTWAEADPSQEIIKIIRVNNDSTWTLEDTITKDSGRITESGYNYLMYGTNGYSRRIKHVNAAADILVLNSDVFAGFSSSFNNTNNKWCLHNLDGSITTTEDIKGRKISYYPAGARDPESESRIYQIDSYYFRGDRIWTPIGTDSANGVLTRWGGVFQALEDRDTTSGGQRPVNITPVGTPGNYSPPDIDTDPYGDGASADRTRHGWKLLRYVKEIEVEYNTNVEELNNYPVGAAVNSFRDLPFPPRPGELNDWNFIWWYEYPGPFSLETLEPADTLAALYDGWNGADRNSNTGEPIGGNNILGRGQIFYCKNAFLEALPGWYRAVDTTTAPYYQRVRSPYPYGRFDENRMPHRLRRQSDGTWIFETINWDMRLAGTDQDNPGPTAFKDGRQTLIKDIAIFQNRLYFAADDTVFASRLGEYEDFWIADPGNITDSDPIDTTLSTNSYAEVEYMIPFRDQLFIVTNASTQFILTGFDNVVSPFTVEVQPISFYSTSGVTNPVAVGNSIYFANNRRMYMYYPQNVEAGMTVEMSKHCPDYLPESPTGLFSATANDTMFVTSPEDWVNGTYPHELFCYVNRYSGNQMTQNALHKWQLDVIHPNAATQATRYSKNKVNIRSSYTKDNYLYVVYSATAAGNGLPIASPSSGIYLGRIFLNDVDLEVPRLDQYFKYEQVGQSNWIYFTNEAVSGFTSLVFTDKEDFLEAAGSTLLQEDFESYDTGDVTIPYVLPNSQITVNAVGDWSSVQTYIGTANAFSLPSSGTKHFKVELGSDVTQTYKVVFSIPGEAYSFSCNISGYQSEEFTVRLYNNSLLVDTVTVPCTGLLDSFLGVVSEAVFDEVEIDINYGSVGFDDIGIDDVTFGYSVPGQGQTWFCIPYSCGQIDTVWLGEGWGLNSYKTLTVKTQAYLDRADSNRPSWIAVEGDYSAPLVNAADVALSYVVTTKEALEAISNPPLNSLGFVTTESTVYKYIGIWVPNNVTTWVDLSRPVGDQNLKATIAFGRRYPMEVELSQQFIRDQQNNVIEGVLSLRQLILRHRNTAEYKVQAYSNNDVQRSFSNFTEPVVLNSNQEVVQIPLDVNGELVAKVLGFSETTKIKITSDSVLPVNITNMTIRGKFRRKNSTFLS